MPFLRIDSGVEPGDVTAGDDLRLAKAANLSDLASPAAARTNLGAGAPNGLATLDAQTLVPAAQLASVGPSSPVGAGIAAAMTQGASNVHLAVLGDSTGVGTTRWPYLLAQTLAARWPEYSVDFRAWNETNVNYDAAVNVQVGTGTGNAGGPYTLTVWNGSKSGANYSYFTGLLTTAATLFPSTPDLVLVSLGHNDGGRSTDYRLVLYSVVRMLANVLGGAPQIALVTQNPQKIGSATTATTVMTHYQRMVEVRRLAAAENLGLVDITARYLTNPTWATDYVQADGVHPTDAGGSPAWAAEVARHFPSTPALPSAPTRSFPLRPTRVWVPASQFIASVGAPVLGIVRTVPVWAMGDAAESAVCASADYPSSWDNVTQLAVWFVATTGTGGVRWQMKYRAMGSDKHLSASSGGFLINSAMSTGSSATGTPTGVAYTTVITALGTSQNHVARPVNFQVGRLGADALDTYTGDAYFAGLIIERWS